METLTKILESVPVAYWLVQHEGEAGLGHESLAVLTRLVVAG